MTLIALHAAKDHADLITDTWSYDNAGGSIAHNSKTHLIPHLDMAIASHGDVMFGVMWDSNASLLSREVADFDEFADNAQVAIAATWAQREADVAAENCAKGSDFKPSPPGVFLVGYSPARESFRAVGFAAEDGFEPWEIEGLFVTPSPLAVRPSEDELTRFRARMRPDVPEDEQNLADMLGCPPPKVPANDEEWVGLALAAHRRATLPTNSLLKVLIGGDLFHTHLELGISVQARVHSFDDSDEALAAVFAGTLHPIGLAGPCECGSGLTFLACCVAKVAGDPCWCGSGQPLGTCCGTLGAI